MSLSYFTIFNPSLGPDEETLSNQLLFYTSAGTSDLDSQLRNIGLIQGIVEFGRSFASDGAEPVNFIKSKHTRSYILELESGFWSVLCLDTTSDESRLDQELPSTNQVLLQLRAAHRLFCLEHKSLAFQLTLGRDLALRTIEAWWMRWAWSWTSDIADASLLCDGFRQTRIRMTLQQEQLLTRQVETLRNEPSIAFHDLLLLISGEYFYSGTTLSCEAKQVIQQYTNDAITTPKTSSPVPLTRDRPPDQLPESTGEEAQAADTTDSWLSGKKWTSESARLFSAMSFHRNKSVPQSSEPDTHSVHAGKWVFSTPKSLHLPGKSNAFTTDDERISVKMNLYQTDTLTFVLLLHGDDPSTAIPQALTNTLQTLANQLDISTVLTNPTNHPLFFSLVHDSSTGAIISTLPPVPSSSSSLALPLHVSESQQQRESVRSNTIHLHAQLFSLSTNRSVSQSILKTHRNIWLISKRDETGTVILAKSGKVGDTMEEIEREAQRWILKLKSLHHS